MRGKLPLPTLHGDTYVVVADAGRARILMAVTENGKLDELADLVNPQARQRTKATEADSLGRAVNSTGKARHAVEPHQTPREHQAEMFAKRIARLLEKARTQGKIRRLYLVAEPGFLGLLRKNLAVTTQRLVAAEIAKSLPHASAAQIRRVLPSPRRTAAGPLS